MKATKEKTHEKLKAHGKCFWCCIDCKFHRVSWVAHNISLCAFLMSDQFTVIWGLHVHFFIFLPSAKPAARVSSVIHAAKMPAVAGASQRLPMGKNREKIVASSNDLLICCYVWFAQSRLAHFLAKVLCRSDLNNSKNWSHRKKWTEKVTLCDTSIESFLARTLQVSDSESTWCPRPATKWSYKVRFRHTIHVQSSISSGRDSSDSLPFALCRTWRLWPLR